MAKQKVQSNTSSYTFLLYLALLEKARNTKDIEEKDSSSTFLHLAILSNCFDFLLFCAKNLEFARVLDGQSILCPLFFKKTNPVKYVDPDGRDIEAAKAVFAFAVSDLFIPDPTDGAALYKAAAYIFIGLVALAFVNTATQTGENEKSSKILYHYSMNPNWRGGVMPPGTFLTDNPNMGSEEARQLLALPNVEPGQQLYLYEVRVEDGQVSAPKPVTPYPSNVTNEILPGGGTEYIAIEPIPVPIPIGRPVNE